MPRLREPGSRQPTSIDAAIDPNALSHTASFNVLYRSMAEQRAQRRLAAILAADVVGYSRLMEQDEAGTLAALTERRKVVLEPLLAKYRGRVVRLMGDGTLAEFGSAVDAVQCAVDLQKAMKDANGALSDDRAIVLRIGLNLGDVVVEEGDLYGDGVNVAARLEAMADPGGICLSAAIHQQVERLLPFTFEDLGDQALKNIARPVRVYCIGNDEGVVVAPRTDAPDSRMLSTQSMPSVAVLPFLNMSGDPEQEVFVDGLTEDLITDLSRTSGLFVIARNSTFAYKGKSVGVSRIARDLGVRYLLEGSARRAAGRVRINVQLIDALGGGHLWAERFDRSLEDIFPMQDEVTGKIVEALVGRLTPLPSRNRPANLEAYELCVRGRVLIGESPASARESRLLLQQAIALDPGYAEAHRWLAFNLWEAWTNWGEPMEQTRRTSTELAERAVTLDPNDAGNRWVLGHVLAYESRWLESDAEFTAAFKLDPNHADAWAMQSDLIVMSGRPADAAKQVQKALRLNPHAPHWYYWMLGHAQYALRQYDRAAETLRKDETYRAGSRRILAATLAQLGRLHEARREAEFFMIRNPHFTISNWTATRPFRDEAVREHFVDGYRKAGLPE